MKTIEELLLEDDNVSKELKKFLKVKFGGANNENI